MIAIDSDKLLNKLDEAQSATVLHTQKIDKDIIDAFFKDEASKIHSLHKVTHALSGLYKKHGVNFTDAGLKQVISNYRKTALVARAKLDVPALDEAYIVAILEKAIEQMMAEGVDATKGKFKEFVTDYPNKKKAKKMEMPTGQSVQSGEAS